MTNIYNLFKFLEEKKGKKIPFKFKLIYAPETIEKEDLNVEGDLDLEDTKISSLPDNLTVGGYLNLYKTKISSLPDNLTVGGSLYLSRTPISSLPKNLQVELRIYLKNTPLADKYSKEQIRKMIEEKGGYVTAIMM